MDVVPNAAFDATFPADEEWEDPPGGYLARKLQAELTRIASRVEDFDIWRDCGWSVDCEIEGQKFEIFFSGLGPDPSPAQWRIGVAPLGQPGALRRSFGAKRTPYLAPCRALSREVHRILQADPLVSNVRWAMNADPSESATRDPDGLDWPPGDPS